MPDQNETVARVSAAFATLPEVVAVAVAGSASTGESDDLSDVDLYVFTREDLPLEKRAAVAYGFAPAAEVGHDRWGPNDEWEDPASGEGVDAVYWTTGWMEDAIDRLLLRHEPSVGYSTCFLHSIRLCRPLHDPSGWLARLKERADGPYPDGLRAAVIRHNHPVLRDTRSSYRAQLGKAVARLDAVSVNHRVAAYLASYFDVIYAVNRVPHPGEKRLLSLTERLCPLRPASMRADVERLVAAGPAEVLVALDAASDGLDVLLALEGLLA